VHTYHNLEAMTPPQIIRGCCPFGPVKGINRVTVHCLQRAGERFGQTRSVGKTIVWLEDHLHMAQEVKLPPEFHLIKLLDHNFKEAKYFSFARIGRAKSIIFVVVDGVLQTVHSGSAKEFQQATPAKI